jgi:non-heme chloroperoxidase
MNVEATAARTRHTITVTDGTEIFFKDWGAGQPIVFSHGSPLNSDAWEDQMVFLADRGYRCIAHDRRGHGRSSQPWTGNDVDTYAADLATLVEELDLHDAVHVGHSTGAGEVVRYIARHGTSHVAKVVLVGAVTPLMVKTARNPAGLPLEAFNGLFLKDLSGPFYGANRPNATVSQAILDAFWLQGMQAGLPGILASIKAFSESDHTDDLKRINVPTLILHGDDDQIVPIAASAMVSATLVKGSTLKVYPGFSNGMCTVNKNQINTDLLAFIRAT